MRRACVLLLILLCCCVARAQQDGIWFLHFRLTNGQVELVNQKRTPGVLKAPRAARSARTLQLDLEAADGATIWSQAVEDPTFKRIEYEDPQQPGRMRVREITTTNVEFTVRVPFRAQARTAVLSRRADRAPAKGIAAAPAARLELGRVKLKWEENP